MSFESRLRQELPRWIAEGAVTDEQAKRIAALYPESHASGARVFLAILAGLGAALCAVGLALIVSANWDAIHRWVKIAALLVLLIGAHGAGYWLKWIRGSHPKVGDAIIAVGCVLFLLGIALVSQIFHLDGRPGDAVLLWIAGIAAVPFLTRSTTSFFLLLAAVYAWLAIESAAPDGWLALSTGRHAGDGMSLGYGLLCGSLALHWTAALWPAAWRSFARLQQAWPIVIICGVVYAAGFLHKTGWTQPAALSAPPALLLAAVAVLAGAAAARKDFTGWRLLSPWLVLAAAPALIAFGGFFGHDAQIACSFLSWITLLALNVFMARAGLRQGQPWLVNLAIAFIALNLFTRYFDLFSSMLNQGLMFLVSGAIVLGLGWYLERKRRALLGAIKRGGAS